MKVWMRDPGPHSDITHARKFHRTPRCHRLTYNEAYTTRKILELDLDEIENNAPCLICFPDAPRIKVSKRYCWECNSSRPCRHNGGIQVPIKAPMARRSWTSEPDDVKIMFRWVWPTTAKSHTSR